MGIAAIHLQILSGRFSESRIIQRAVKYVWFSLLSIETAFITSPRLLKTLLALAFHFIKIREQRVSDN
jgi:hypothetical protein